MLPLPNAAYYRQLLALKLIKNLAHLETDHAKKEAFESCAPGTEKFDKLGKVIEKIMEKYKDEVNKLSSPEAISALNEVSEKYKDNATCDEYFQEVSALCLRYAPLLAHMDAEMLQAQQEIQQSDSDSIL